MDVTKRELPPGWRWVKLGEVCEITMGQSPEGSSYNTAGHGEPLLNGPTEFGCDYPTAVQWTASPTRFSDPGDILLCVRGATTGRKNIANRRYCIGRGLAAVRGKRGVGDNGFLWFALDLATNKILGQASGSTFPNIPAEKLANIEIALPPLEEQKRIAAILNEQMGAVERARAAAQSQLDSAKALPKAYLRKFFPQPCGALASGWRWVKLGEFLRVKSGDFLPASQMDPRGPFPVYGGNGIAGRHSAYMFEDSKVIIGRVGALCGCVHITEPKSWVTDNALYVEITRGPIDSKFLYYCLTQLDLRCLANQMGQPVVSGSSIYAASVALPPLVEQKPIAALLNAKMKEAEQLAAGLEAQLDEINALPASMLARAFRGEI